MGLWKASVGVWLARVCKEGSGWKTKYKRRKEVEKIKRSCVQKNKVQKECPKEKKIEKWKKEVVRKRKRKGEKRKKENLKKRVCFRIKGWGE